MLCEEDVLVGATQFDATLYLYGVGLERLGLEQAYRGVRLVIQGLEFSIKRHGLYEFLPVLAIPELPMLKTVYQAIELSLVVYAMKPVHQMVYDGGVL